MSFVEVLGGLFGPVSLMMVTESKLSLWLLASPKVKVAAWRRALLLSWDSVVIPTLRHYRLWLYLLGCPFSELFSGVWSLLARDLVTLAFFVSSTCIVTLLGGLLTLELLLSCCGTAWLSLGWLLFSTRTMSPSFDCLASGFLLRVGWLLFWSTCFYSGVWVFIRATLIISFFCNQFTIRLPMNWTACYVSCYWVKCVPEFWESCVLVPFLVPDWPCPAFKC